MKTFSFKESLPAALAEKVNEVCNRFEAAWKDGPRPRLEEFLADTAEPERPALLCELILLDLAYRRQAGEKPATKDYAHWFPGFLEKVQALFKAAGLAEPAAAQPNQTLAGGIAPDTVAPQEADGANRQPATVSFLNPDTGAVKKSNWPRIAGYQILGELGHGAMGVVYKARQIQLKRLIALKMILSGIHALPDELARFRTEAETVARLQHPNIVQIYEIGEHEGRPFFSLEFVEGGTLVQKLAGNPQPPRQAAKLIETLARAMHAAHQCGIIHRDLKPGNVLLMKDGAPKVADFGLAKQLDADQAQTQTGAILGTPSYMAPEQAAGRNKEVGPATDVYALGAILYEILTGRPPFKGENTWDTLEQVQHQEPVLPSKLQSKVPRDLESICLKCLAKVPAARYATARELANDLRRFQADLPIRARPIGKAERLWRWCKRKPMLAAASGGGLMLALVFLVILRANSRARLTLTGHKGPVECVSFSPDGSYLASGSWDCTVKIWDLATGKETLTLTGHKNVVRRVTFSPDGRRLASGSDGTVKIWDLATGKETLTLTGDCPAVRFSPDGGRLASTELFRSGTLQIWDLAGGKKTLTLDGNASGSVAFCPDGRRLASGSEGATVKIWDLATGKETLTLPAEKDNNGIPYSVSIFSFSPDGLRLATRGLHVRIWDLATGKEMLKLLSPGNFISPDFRRLASYDWNGKMVRIWDLETGEETLPLTGHKGLVKTVSFSPDGRRLASGSEDETVKIWDLATGKETLTLTGHNAKVTSVSFRPDGRCLASGSWDLTVKIWDLAAGKETRGP